MASGNDTKKATVEITDRKVILLFHNGWSCVNSRGMNNSQGLVAGNPDYRKGNDKDMFISYTLAQPLDLRGISSNDKCMMII